MDELIAAVAEKIGFDVQLSDFVPCGKLHATETGLAACRSIGFRSAIRKITDCLSKHENLTRKARKRVHDVEDQAFFYAAIAVCTDETGKAEATNEDIAAFINANREPLARLLMPAFMANLPGVLEQLGISE